MVLPGYQVATYRLPPTINPTNPIRIRLLVVGWKHRYIGRDSTIISKIMLNPECVSYVMATEFRVNEPKAKQDLFLPSVQVQKLLTGMHGITARIEKTRPQMETSPNRTMHVMRILWPRNTLRYCSNNESFILSVSNLIVQHNRKEKTASNKFAEVK
jgi:hypothetical protein